VIFDRRVEDVCWINLLDLRSSNALLRATLYDQRGDALAEAAAGRADDAIAWYYSFPDYQTASAAHLVLHAAAQQRIASIHDGAGCTADAARHYARFIELWSGTAPELQPEIDAARTRLAELSRSRGD
jgi:hypothetical protein